MKMDVPKGMAHLEMIFGLAAETRKESLPEIDKHLPELKLLGTSLAALYEASTCNRKCFGGGHVLESLAGRVYNLASSAYILSLAGFYDEALNLIRSIGEISNLISLSS